MEQTPGLSKFDLWLGRARSILVILVGAVISYQQTFMASEPNPLLIGLAGLCLGLPVTLGLDRKIR